MHKYCFFCKTHYFEFRVVHLNFAAWKRRRISSMSWWMTCRSRQKSTFRCQYFSFFQSFKKCCSSLFVGVILSHWIIFSPILRSERRWQQLRWFSVLATFQNFFTLDRNNVWWISSLHQIPIDCWTVRFLICFLLSIFHWFPHPAQPIQNCKYLVLVSVKIRVTEKC